MGFEFLGEPLHPFWTLMAAAVLYIAVRDAHVRPVWKYLGRMVVAFLIGLGAGAEIAVIFGIGKGLSSSLLTIFSVMVLDELSNPKLLRRVINAKLGNNENGGGQ